MFPTNKSASINENRPSKKTGKPINQSKKPEYIGCLIFEVK